jgi:hypothetical protein
MARITRADRQSVADAELIAWLLDNSIPVPGTGRRIGLDAVIGLVPGLGDILAGGLGLLIVARGVQRGLPTVVLARMLTNVGLDFAIGSIPIIGDAFDLWYKSNARNVALLRRHAGNPGASTAAQWTFFIGLLAVIGAVAIGFVWLVWAVMSALFG